MHVNEIEAMYKARVNLKVERSSTSTLTRYPPPPPPPPNTLPLFYLRVFTAQVKIR